MSSGITLWLSGKKPIGTENQHRAVQRRNLGGVMARAAGQRQVMQVTIVMPDLRTRGDAQQVLYDM